RSRARRASGGLLRALRACTQPGAGGSSTRGSSDGARRTSAPTRPSRGGGGTRATASPVLLQVQGPRLARGVEAEAERLELCAHVADHVGVAAEEDVVAVG